MLLGDLGGCGLVDSTASFWRSQSIVDPSEGEDQIKLKYNTDAMIASRSSGKSTYATWLRFFDEADGRKSEYMVESFLLY